MISLERLAELAADHVGVLAAQVAPVWLGDFSVDADVEPVIMGSVNLSRDSTYRVSIATSTESAVRKGLVMSALGAHVVDVGAESSTARATRVSPEEQAARLVPVVTRLAKEGVVVSAETYDVDVARACLEAGARVLNLTGPASDEAMFELAAEYSATVVLCYLPGADARDIGDVVLTADPIPALLEHFGARIERARELDVERLVIDPGLGFFYANLVDPTVRVAYQSRVLLHGFRLRELGVPVCQALPHAFDVFEDEFRTAEGYFAVLARLGKASMLRTHEVARVAAVLRALAVDVPAW